jgi:DNA-directed RNA polymerase subunit M/transcription elongation factor TFIIS
MLVKIKRYQKIENEKNKSKKLIRMNPKEITNILKTFTKLTTTQIKELADVIIEYDENDEVLYQAIGLLEDGINYKTIINDFSKGKFFWDNQKYAKFRENRAFKDNALKNPPEVREGELECPKCKQKKTLVVEMQTRSADEGFTYFIHCLNDNCRAITK